MDGAEQLRLPSPEDLGELVTTHRPAPGRDLRVAVFYLHGGGMLYGTRDDLPRPYVQSIVDAGYTLVCADYPLAPETPVPEAARFTLELLRTCVLDRVSDGSLRGYFLFGRSSGAFLSLLLARDVERAGLPKPLGVLDFYGYHSLAEPWLRAPAREYARLPEVTRKQVETIVGARGQVVTSGPKPRRFSLYVHARQHEGAWLELLGLDGRDGEHTPEACSLLAEDVAALPPLFMCASSTDEDVPYRASKTLSRLATSAVLKTVYNLPHDFDRDLSVPDGRRAYEQALQWMGTLLPR